jgi:hypothetical protein
MPVSSKGGTCPVSASGCWRVGDNCPLATLLVDSRSSPIVVWLLSRWLSHPTVLGTWRRLHRRRQPLGDHTTTPW